MSDTPTTAGPGAQLVSTEPELTDDTSTTHTSDVDSGAAADSEKVRRRSNRGLRLAGKRKRRRFLELCLFLVPAIGFNLIWGWYPLLTSFALSFTSAQVRGPVDYTGLESYHRMWNDPLVGQAFKVTLVFTGLTIVLTFVLPILVAILLMEMRPRMRRWMMLLWFLPLSPIAGAVLWKYFYDAQNGLFQWIATHIGLPRQEFLNSSSQVLFWLTIPGLVLYGPGLIYMATLQSIPASYYEAAEIEGAGFWRKIWTVSLPRMRPVILMMLMFALIGSMQEFQWPTLMTGGGPGGSSRTAVMYVYSLLQTLRYADATALSILLFVVIIAMVVILRVVLPEDPDAPPRRVHLRRRRTETEVAG